MKLLVAFLRLVRTLNLVFIAFTQLLFLYCVVIPVFQQSDMPLVIPIYQFVLLAIASVLIAAGGYIINDYFDLNIDQVNKPRRLVVEKIIKRRWAIVWHWVLSAAGILLSTYVAWKIRVWWLAPANLCCVIALWFYSTTFKRKLLSGNIIISLLTAWTVMVVGFIVHYKVIKTPGFYGLVEASKIMRITFLYAGFAFIISLIREVIKDIEDMAGDQKYGCRTMPIVWGVNVSKVFVATWIIVLVAALIIVQAYVLTFEWWGSALYCVLLIIIPLLYILRKLYTAQASREFHHLSGWIKLVMLTGIVSMIFFKIYFA
ncbi:geranylgeranylglycerol-phosphate geranylgeranyltransferase [Paraflavitalea speifideaquila]|uniref:geranylgeranylglycerol-phosphate geranylgeranyltransferase n=1 Tax=Paraflavitalea speifideaquila TaxID=3076558 RepID=UPI0028E5DF45|nr:geranylgeranylglycerol-phosphate geranylgeranyltransferase [Paraflavitalea speifideiaquila]